MNVIILPTMLIFPLFATSNAGRNEFVGLGMAYLVSRLYMRVLERGNKDEM